MAQKNYTAERSDYMTPFSIYSTLLQIAQREIFDIDVCCSRKNIPAIHHFIDGRRDGLKEVWHGDCFLNPPFKTAVKWIRKAVEAVKDSDNTRVFAVIPADRLETKYYQECILKNKYCVFCFLPYKAGFIIPGQEDQPPKPSQKIMIAIFSKDAAVINYAWDFHNWFNTLSFLGRDF